MKQIHCQELLDVVTSHKMLVDKNNAPIDTFGQIGTGTVLQLFIDGRGWSLNKQLGLSLNTFKADGRAYLVQELGCRLFRRIQHGNEIMIHTWIKDWNEERFLFRGLIANRTTNELVMASQLMGKAIDLQTGKRTTLPDSIHSEFDDITDRIHQLPKASNEEALLASIQVPVRGGVDSLFNVASMEA